MDEETKKRFPKEINILETKNSLIKGPAGLNDSVSQVEMGLPDTYKNMEKERYSIPNIEELENRIDILKTQENVNPDLIEHLEEMKKALKLQIRADLIPVKEIQGFTSVEDMVRDEQSRVVKGIRQSLSEESVKMINKQIESDPGIFRSKYPELFDYVKSLEED
jgi:hypothetical protein